MKSKTIAKWIIAAYLLIAIFHPFIANEKPLYCVINGQAHFPILTGKNIDIQKASKVIMPPVPFSAQTINTNESFSPPLSGNHILGTDILGRDTFAGILNGTEIAVKVGFISVFFASFIALLIGLLVAYCSRFSIRIHWVQMIFFVISLLWLIYWFWISLYSSTWYFLIIFMLVVLVNGAVWRLTFRLPKSYRLPIDEIYLRIIEAMKALPTLVLLLACLTLFDHFTIYSLILILSLIMWPSLSRYIRAETKKVLVQDYVTAAKSYGASGLRILLIHVLPKLIPSLSVILAFSISSAIIVESTLSFLGLGLPIEDVSWGSMLKEGQRNLSAWWLALFPGLALFGLILSLNLLGSNED